MSNKKTFYDREFHRLKPKNYSSKELIYYLEILPINRQSAMSTVAKLKLIDLPTKKPEAWKIDIENQGAFWIPYSCITAYDPNTKMITVKSWILKEKGIKYKTL